MYSNADILSAVINKWAQPLVGTFINGHMQSFPFVQGLQNKVRAMGWVSPNWTLFAELAPLMEGISGNILSPRNLSAGSRIFFVSLASPA